MVLAAGVASLWIFGGHSDDFDSQQVGSIRPANLIDSLRVQWPQTIVTRIVERYQEEKTWKIQN